MGTANLANERRLRLGGSRGGAVLGFALLVPGAWSWWGFALPFPPVLAAARSALVLLAWKDLS
jgi:hypothetical protein